MIAPKKKGKRKVRNEERRVCQGQRGIQTHTPRAPVKQKGP